VVSALIKEMLEESDLMSTMEQHRVLIVDDSKDYAKMLERLLRAKGGVVDVTVCYSIDEGRVLIDKGERYALYFIDYNFPTGGKGTDFLRYLQQSGCLANSAAFLITSEPTLKNMEEATAAGAVGVVAKPFDIQQLLSQIELAKRKLFSDGIDYF
jgi:DNA-binding NtrC family response regulator